MQLCKFCIFIQVRLLYDILTTITAFAAAHGVFIAIALMVQRKENRKANIWLAILVLLFSLYIAEFGAYWSRFFLEYPHLLFTTNSFPLLFGPLLWFYLRRLLWPAKMFTKSDLLHFIPFLAYVIYLTPFYLTSAQDKADVLRAIWSGDSVFGTPFYLIRIFMVIHIFAYSLASLYQAIPKAKQAARSSLQTLKVNWGKRVSLAFAAIAILKLLQLGSIAFLHYKFIYQIDATILSLSAILILACGFSVVLEPVLFSGLPVVKAYPRYNKSSMSAQDSQRLANELRKIMAEQRLYEHHGLTLNDVAGRLNISPHQLSQLLNQHLNQGFFEYVNSYRVNAAKLLLQDPSKSHFTILSIAHEVGFNSKASFNAAFKKLTGYPPSHFRDSR